MEEDQERCSSSDEERRIIVDEDMEELNLTNLVSSLFLSGIPELWMSDRNNEDTKFVRVK